MKLKKTNKKKDSKQIKSNQKNEDSNWNKNKIGGQLVILSRLVQLPRICETKEGGYKKFKRLRITLNHCTCQPHRMHYHSNDTMVGFFWSLEGATRTV
jgi:hypothetical protein